MPPGGNSAKLRTVRKVPPSRRPTVCLFSLHPLLSTEFQRLLPAGEFRLLVRRLEPTRISDLQRQTIPRASIYVVEAHTPPQATETLVAAVLGRYSTARLLVVAEEFRESSAFPLLRLGTKGLIRYAEVASILPRALREVAEGGFWVPRSLLSRFVDASLEVRRRPSAVASATPLSPREREVLELLLENLSNKEIASRLKMSERTAKFHVSNLLAKYGVKRRADLILLHLTNSRYS